MATGRAVRSVLAASTGLLGAAVSVRFIEEIVPFERVDHLIGITRASEETIFWRATHSPTEAVPDLHELRAENKIAIRSSVARALSYAAADSLGMPREATRYAKSTDGQDERLPRVEEEETFVVSKRQSTIADSGDGAHLSGRVSRGEVVTFYHGSVHSPIVGRVWLALASWRSEYVLMLHDSYLLAGSPAGGTSHGRGGSSWLAGPLANHPPAGVPPNAMLYSATLDASELPAASAEALGRISEYAWRPLLYNGRRTRRCVALVALRDLEDEEILVDYAFDPDGADLPPWYHPVRAEGADAAPRGGFEFLSLA